MRAALGMADRAAFLAGDWAEALAGAIRPDAEQSALYSEPRISPELMPEVARYEPRSALDGGADGLDAYRAIIAALPRSADATGGLRCLNLGPVRRHM